MCKRDPRLFTSPPPPDALWDKDLTSNIGSILFFNIGAWVNQKILVRDVCDCFFLNELNGTNMYSWSLAAVNELFAILLAFASRCSGQI